MTKTYRARLHGDRVEWLGESPPLSPDDTPLEIDILVPEKRTKVFEPQLDLGPPDFSKCADPEKSRQIYEALTRLQKLPSCFPEDAVAWQREERRDRILPGRENDD